MKTNRRHAVAALIAAGLLWGTSVPLSKLALAWLSPAWLTAVRFGLAAAVLLAAAIWRPARRTELRDACTPGVLVAGASGYGGSVMVQNAGITRTSVTHAALLIGAVPVLVAIIAAVWHRAVARPVAWFGFVVSLGGVGLVTTGGGGGGATLAGDGLVLASLLLSATVTVAQGRLLTGRDPVAVTAVQFVGAALGTLPVAVVSEGALVLPESVGPVLAVAALAACGTLLPFTLFAFGQSRVSAEVAGAFLNLEPLVGATAGAVAFGDRVGLAQVFGGAAILTGIGLSSLPLLAARRRSTPIMAKAESPAPVVSGAGAPASASAEAAELAGAGAAELAGAEAAESACAGAPALAGAEAAESAGAEAPALAGAEPLTVTYEPLVLAGAGVVRAKPPEFNECDSLPNRVNRAPRSLNPRPRHGRQNTAFVMVCRGEFGAGTASRVRPAAEDAGIGPGGAAVKLGHGGIGPGGAGVELGHGPIAPRGAGVELGHGGIRPGGAGIEPEGAATRPRKAAGRHGGWGVKPTGSRPGGRVAGRPPNRGRKRAAGRVPAKG